jgi:tetratricopeptide (TPR) repeat protein
MALGGGIYMRVWLLVSVAAVALPLSPLHAADKLQFGPPPSWVVPIAAPTIPPTAADNRAFTVLEDDEQAMLEKGKRSYFSESIYRIDSPQGLDNGNISLTWDPATDALTVHKLIIRRGNQVIDVLKSGQAFTTMRRETNLEEGMLDGQLTATLLPEGLQVGDIIELATTYVHTDPVTKDSTEVELATFNGNPIGHGYARLSWPSSLPVTFRTAGDLPTPKVTRKDGISTIEYDMKDIEPLVLPENAPGRFRNVRALDASTFSDWNEIAALMKPYYDAAAVIPAAGPLHDEVEKIKQLPGGALPKAEAALKLVQDRIRYIALSMGSGGYLPASADTTWSRRFGDCKAKTALLLAILRELHIESEPVLANTGGNDGLDAAQPMIGSFNHVLVRATIGGKAYWLDGTRSGDLSLDQLQVPAYDWGLPVAAKASLVRMIPDPLRQPTIEVALNIDAREGIGLPAPTTIDYVFRGDVGHDANIKLNGTQPSQREQFIREFFKSTADDWKASIVSLDPKSVSSRYDAATGELHLSFDGFAKLDWSNANFYVQFSALAYKPNFERSEGINRTAPIAIDYPSYTRSVESIRLPAAFLKRANTVADIKETVAGVEYFRHAAFSGDAFKVETTERAIAPEVPYADALSASARLRELNNDSLSLFVPDDYRWSDKELAARMAEKLTTASEFVERGTALLGRDRYDEAISDLTSAIALDSKNGQAFAERALAYSLKHDNEHAHSDVRSAIALDPGNVVANRVRGLVAEDEQKWSEAIDAYSASLAKDPSNLFTVGHRAIVLAAADRDDEALTDSATVLAKEPGWYGLREIRGAIFLQRHQCGDVLKEAQAIANDVGDDASGLAVGARLFVVCQQRDQGFALFAKALKLKPNASIYISRAQSRPASDTAGRIADIEAAIKLEPKKAAWVAVEADEMDRQGNEAKALALYDEALKLAPDDFDLSVNRATVIYRMGRADEARKLFADLRTRAKTAMMLNNLCWQKATAGILLDSALSDCNDSLKMSPDSGAALDSLGMTLLKLGRFDDAIQAYDKAIAKGTGAVSLMGRSVAYSRKGDAAKADADHKAAVADDPDIASRAKRYGLDF